MIENGTSDITYHIASFVCALFVLEIGADKFIDHAAVVAKRTGIPEVVIGLLTAGGEWEELSIVIISLSRHRSSLAVGNVVGSTISNILGAFSLGLLFRSDHSELVFDQSSRIYSLILLVWTTVIAICAGFKSGVHYQVLGGLSIAFFSVYIAVIAWTISRGRLIAPEALSDSDTDSDTDDERILDEERSLVNERTSLLRTEVHASSSSSSSSSSAASSTSSNHRTVPRFKDSLAHHVCYLVFGLFCILLSSYVLSHAATAIADFFGISDIVFGVVVLSIATTLPEKFIATISGYKGHAGILVANTVGSNVFLLSLCMGIMWLINGGEYDGESANLVELGVMVASTVAMTLVVWIGFGPQTTRWVGGFLLAAYVGFLVLEVTVIRTW